MNTLLSVPMTGRRRALSAHTASLGPVERRTDCANGVSLTATERQNSFGHRMISGEPLAPRSGARHAPQGDRSRQSARQRPRRAIPDAHKSRVKQRLSMASEDLGVSGPSGAGGELCELHGHR